MTGKSVVELSLRPDRPSKIVEGRSKSLAAKKSF